MRYYTKNANLEFRAVQKRVDLVDLVDLERAEKSAFELQNPASIQPRTLHILGNLLPTP